MKTIYKYQLNDYVLMPKGAKPLHVNHQGGDFVWALVDNSQPMVTHRFNVVGTGWDLTYVNGEYLGTLHEPNGMVWHAFYNGETT